MAIMNQLLKHQLPVRVFDCFVGAGNMFIKDTIESKRVDFINIETKSQMRKWWVLTQDEYILPVSVSPYYFDDQAFDEYEFSTTLDNLVPFSGYIIGDFELATIPVFKPYGYENILIDFLTSSISYSILGEFRQATLNYQVFLMMKSLEMKCKNLPETDLPNADFTVIPDDF